MLFRFHRIDYGKISRRLQTSTKAAALRPYVRLLVLLSTFIALLAAIIIKEDALPALASPVDGPSGDCAWRDLQHITQEPHPWNSRENDRVRNYILSEMNKGNSISNESTSNDSCGEIR